ncbi:MAG TPA: LapA family protein [Dongiaceae bacterium]|nr:LapA family protein [Dongiaceae bacterium]
MKQISYIFGLILAAILVVFAIDNGAAMTISLWPLPWQATLPGFIALFIALVIGFLVGAVAVWFSGSKARKRARDLADTARAQAHQIAEQERRYAAARAAAAPAPPAAPASIAGALPPPR